jgi:hypothetical protein
MQQAPFQFDLFPAQVVGFRNPATVPIRDQDQRCVTKPVSSDASGRLDQVTDFFLGQVLAAAQGPVGNAPWRWIRASVDHRRNSRP